MTSLSAATTALFVPGNRPDRFVKARFSGADVVILDLEDAVATDDKAAARMHVAAAISAGFPCVVRVSDVRTPEQEKDLAALRPLTSRPQLLGIMVAKTEDGSDLDPLEGFGAPIIALIESARGVHAVESIATDPRVARVALGGHDLSVDLDVSPDSRTMSAVGARVVIASRLAGLAPPWDSPSTQLKDSGAVLREARQSRGDGFGGKLCIHPSQIEPVRQAFHPTDAEVNWATSVLAAGDGAVRVGGEMGDRPVLLRAERILSRAKELSR